MRVKATALHRHYCEKLGFKTSIVWASIIMLEYGEPLRLVGVGKHYCSKDIVTVPLSIQIPSLFFHRAKYRPSPSLTNVEIDKLHQTRVLFSNPLRSLIQLWNFENI